MPRHDRRTRRPTKAHRRAIAARLRLLDAQHTKRARRNRRRTPQPEPTLDERTCRRCAGHVNPGHDLCRTCAHGTRRPR